MEVKEIKSPLTGDSYYKIKHKSGLNIYVYEKEGYNSTYAIFGTKFGSINNCFSVDGGEKIKVPDGIAHYLEHKLFESEDGDAFAKYALTGANANAYTSFDKTCYLFSASQKFKESLEILIDFVQSPYFTDETVAKEQGIIGQEIKMYDDSPEWRVLFNLLECLYHNHPVKIDIAGTVETIAEITPKKLYDCYNTFYNLNNMALCVCGKAKLNEVLEVADRLLKPSKDVEITNYFEDEPREIVANFKEQNLPVAVPLFEIGFKGDGTKLITSKQEAATDVLLGMLFSQSGELYRELQDKELINQSFGYEVFEGMGFYSVLLSGESHNPERVYEIIKNYINKVRDEGLSVDDYQENKRAVYGSAIRAMNSTDSIANNLMECHFTGREFFNYADEVYNLKFEDVQSRFNEILDCSNSALSVIR
ncbi:MAG: insulinase family protein [Ruminococcus sp.]|nr:insulinase family protein [Ruminococcus sp.]